MTRALSEAGPDGGSSVALQMGELVLKTARFEEMYDWYSHMLGHGAFFERFPDEDVAPRPAGTPERAVDVRVAFFEIHDNGHPFDQVLGLFGIDSLAGAVAGGPGLHHFQFAVAGIGDLITQYEHMTKIGAVPHRAANHGQATSYYFRDPDGNVIEFSCPNFATPAEVRSFMATPEFAANPSGLELDPANFAARYRSGESLDRLLSLEVSAGVGT